MSHPLVSSRGRWMRDVLTDEQVVERVQGGETELFELLVRRHNQRLFRTVRTRVRDDDEAEEALQESYVTAWRRISTFEGRSLFMTWMTRIALRTATEVASRRSRAEELAGMAQSVASPPSDRSATDTELDSGELRRWIERAIDRLPEAQRLVFVLRAVEGLSTVETARDLELSEATVKVRLFRARRRMMADLTRHAREVGSLASAWSFAGERCDRVTARVMGRLLG